jgi:hypothetical protein
MEHMSLIRQGEYVFPGGKAGKPLSNMAMLKLLDRMGYGDLFEKRRELMSAWANFCSRSTRRAYDV